MVNVTTSENNGKSYSNVANLSPLPGALKNAKPAAVHGNVIFDLDKPDMDVFHSLHEKMQIAIRQSPEGAHLEVVASGNDDDVAPF
jgi:hypothetical protein